MKRQIVALLLAAAALPQAAAAQDVKVFSPGEAEDVLADPAPADAAPADDSCPVRLPNGTCARTSDERGFSFAPPKAAAPAPARSGQPPVARVGAPAATARTPAPRAAATTARHARASTPARATVRPRGHEVPLQFALGSFELSPQSKANLQTLAAALNAPQNIAKRIRISGHTDRSGSLEANRQLSQQRADAAAAYLVSQGVDRARIEAQGRGFDEPLAGISPFSPSQRRVEVLRVE